MERHDGIVRITLNRPEVLNAMHTPLLRELKTCAEEIAHDPSLDVVILTGAGKAFCAGMDLKAIGEPPEPGEPDPALLIVEALHALENLPCPVIGAINGYAITGGLELALSCDILLASEKAVFGDTHAQFGLMPGGGNTQKLPRVLGMSRAKEILFASEYISAEEAHRLGMVSQVLPEDKLMEAAEALAERIGSADRETVRRMKFLVNRGAQLGLIAGLNLEAVEYYRFCTGGGREAVAERRQEIMERGRRRTSTT